MSKLYFHSGRLNIGDVRAENYCKGKFTKNILYSLHFFQLHYTFKTASCMLVNDMSCVFLHDLKLRNAAEVKRY